MAPNSSDSLWTDVELGGERFRRLRLDHPGVEERIVAEITAGAPVYYDREWPMTRRFCRWLVRHRPWVEERRVLVVGAGVGMEAVVAGRFAAAVEINDLSPLALDLLGRQLRANEIEPVAVHACSFAEVPLAEELELVLACFAVFHDASASAMERLLVRAAARDLPVLLAGRNLGGHLERVLGVGPRDPEWLAREDGMWIAAVR